MEYILGSKLPLCLQLQAKAMYAHRSVSAHPSTGVAKVQFASDEDWLAHTWFAVTKKGTFDARVKHCKSNPTWPYNPELRHTYDP